MAIDATFGTNNAGMDLFAVFAAVDGTGIPLAYCFLDVFEDNSHQTRWAEAGATTAVISQFLLPLRDSGLTRRSLERTRTFQRSEQYVGYGPTRQSSSVIGTHDGLCVQILLLLDKPIPKDSIDLWTLRC